MEKFIVWFTEDGSEEDCAREYLSMAPEYAAESHMEWEYYSNDGFERGTETPLDVSIRLEDGSVHKFTCSAVPDIHFSVRFDEIEE